MEAASLCPKCGIELQAELGSRCPLCGTPLRVNEYPTASYATTNPAIPSPGPGPAAIIPQDPATAPTGVLPLDDSATTTSGWSIEASPPSVPDALRPAPSSPFTPMPALVAAPAATAPPPPPPPATLPPPPFAAGIPLRPAAAPLPGPPVLGPSPLVADPDSAVTAVMAGPPLPASRPLIVEQGVEGDDEDAVDASSLEITRNAPGPPVPATIPAARAPQKEAPSGSARAVSRPSPSAIARGAVAPAPAARPGSDRRAFYLLATVLAAAVAFAAGRITAPAVGSFPLPPISTPSAAVTPEASQTEEAAPSSPEETGTAPEPSTTP